ncbi:hypothetical protein O3M35_010690 [Rhynocoris fuscipes]|uniref:Transmembrane protein 120 homolog n=1 Tax=Rhynocoris fuscipes TaxID=488301 RepID=A0AAW1D5B2_9HEMI
MELQSVSQCVEQWEELQNDFQALEATNSEYLEKLEQLNALQAKCTHAISHQRYRMGIIKRSLKKLNITEDEDKEIKQRINRAMARREANLVEVEHCLPKPNGMYLKIILGNVNVSILNKEDKFKYKDEYEKFKLILSGIGFLLSVANLCTKIRVLELSFLFLLVWYYCTLTIRESILKVNGSKIKGWWRLHHFISTVASAVLLIWPLSDSWYEFRPQFMIFNVYISIVQYLQFRYQQGALYRLKALGERHNMDITIEGFHSWMWRGLGFLLPFLYAGYIFQLYLAVALFRITSREPTHWQVPVLGILFFILFLGNTITTSLVIPQKIKENRARREIIKTEDNNHKVEDRKDD